MAQDSLDIPDLQLERRSAGGCAAQAERAHHEPLPQAGWQLQENTDHAGVGDGLDRARLHRRVGQNFFTQGYAMSLRHGLLGLLAEGPASGYDLARRFQEVLGQIWPAQHPKIYAELGRLADDGLIAVDSEGPRRRKAYRITEAGLDEIRSWLASGEVDHTMRLQSLLRSLFFWLMDPDDLRRHLDGVRIRSGGLAKHGKRISDFAENSACRCGKYDTLMSWTERLQAWPSDG